MTTDVSAIMASYGGRTADASNEQIIATMGNRKARLAGIGPDTATGDADADFSLALTGVPDGTELSAVSDPVGFTIDDDDNLIATAPDADEYAVTVTATNPNAADSPHEFTITVTIS